MVGAEYALIVVADIRSSTCTGLNGVNLNINYVRTRMLEFFFFFFFEATVMVRVSENPRNL